MKKSALFLVALLCMALLSASCFAGDKIIPVEQLPAAAQQFVKTNFPNAKIYIAPEDADAMKLEGENIVRAQYGKAYKNFPNAQQVAEGIWFIEAKGHTKGNSIVIAEDEGLFYMLHGDVTYCDAALKANKLSIVFEDKDAARQTLDRVREFIQQNPTVYLSTHCPEGYENLELKRVMKL